MRDLLAFLFFFLIASTPLLAYDTNTQELSVSDINYRLVHGLKHVGDDAISLYKEGGDLRIILGYYQCNPFMTDFDIKSSMREGGITYRLPYMVWRPKAFICLVCGLKEKSN